MTIVWKDIPNWENLYRVSNTGLVYGVTKGVILAPFLAGIGYPAVKLRRKPRIQTSYVHRLVAEAFCEKPQGATEVNHKNGCKTDNSAENLEWVTSSQNKRHAINTGLMGGRGTSKYYGVFWNIQRRAWMGRVLLHGKQYGARCFPTELEAAKYVDELLEALQLHDRRRNFVPN